MTARHDFACSQSRFCMNTFVPVYTGFTLSFRVIFIARAYCDWVFASDRSAGNTDSATSNRSDSEAEATGNSSLEGNGTPSTSSVSNLHDWQPQAPVPDSHTVCTDIGLLLRKGACLRKWTDDHKLKIARLDPDPHANYPSVFMDGCNRRFKVQWLQSHPWLHYSSSEDGLYCRACALFSPEEVSGQRLGVLIITTEPFRLRHEKLDYHHNAVVRMQEFVKVCENPSINIANRLNRERELHIEHNKEVVQSLFECILFCRTQGISLRMMPLHLQVATEAIL